MWGGGVSIAALFVAGYAPGILVALSLMAVCAVYAKRHGFPAGERLPLAVVWKHTLAALPSLFLIVLSLAAFLAVFLRPPRPAPSQCFMPGCFRRLSTVK